VSVLKAVLTAMNCTAQGSLQLMGNILPVAVVD